MKSCVLEISQTLLHYSVAQCAHVIFKCMHLSSEHDILPVDHAGTRSHGCLKQMAVNMKKLLQTLLFLRSAGLEASRKTAGGT